jgi:hypothetical protein
MAYTKFHAAWADDPDTSTPITAEALDHIEQGISDAADAADAGGDITTDDAWVAKGDLIAGTGTDAATIKTVGSNDSVLTAASGQAAGIIWQKIGNSMVATDAAIDVSKMAPSATANDILRTVGGVAVWGAQAVAAVTALPGSPVEGQEVTLVDSLTSPTFLWRFKYYGALSANKWVFIGGAPRFAGVATSETLSTTGSYQALSTAGPSVVIPVAGSYLVTQGAELFGTNVAVYLIHMSYDIGGTGATDTDAIAYMTEGGSDRSKTVVRTNLKTLTALTLTSKYKTATNGATFSKRYLSVIPVAVGG